MRECFAAVLSLAGLAIGSNVSAQIASSPAPSPTPWRISWGELDAHDAGWRLSDHCDCPLEFGGWVSAGFTSNAHGNRTGDGNQPMAFNNVADTPVMNQFWVFLEKPLNMETRDVDWGFRVDHVFGADGPDTQALGDRGWDYTWDTSRDYGSAIPQLYGELGLHDLILRVGYAYGVLGFEATQAVDNFFYSHNYAFHYGVPGTHSGAALEYKLGERLELIGAWTTGWDSWWTNYISGSTFVGGLTWSMTDQTSLSYHTTVGDFGDGTAKNGVKDENKGRIYAHAIVFTYDFSSRGTYVLEHILGSNSGLGRKNNQWYSITNYLFWDLTERCSVGGRFEWFRDDDGARVDVNGAGRGSFYETTLGLNIRPHPNIRIRPEIRWDWFSGRGKPFDSRDGGKMGTAIDQFTGGLDVIMTF